MPTEFETKVYNLTKKIPKGKVTTYKIIVEKLGTKAYRAVGNALRKNKNLIMIPCHRVVNSNGSLGGYKGIKNSKEKIKLLRKEGVEVKCGNMDLNEHLYSF